ncbi:MAG: ATP-dependent helicase HrpB [Yaniella sp.]|uniref:ATP-dependent helicase HrpB n=3 Tax=Yaniella sp. TaxID=2773929 RepID=UPI002648CC48|nr:ATP-dependent helicase HrpB [Yaniella sp.]MDN5732455.1 ATP-dependent helicase HrpB [Yaniella sp.]MDN5815037.1 ATP-dependent helicase HrpB [Yaniella sp.]MDN5890317.1 ATP-dependent helicase HrpB [Yaniella sp.]MDN5912367.1 ATP-dependent helicase HrpB [Yaniella sp.]MDN6172841.1 ATP-dependent helicase HrpB [Yaniella sp.]
MNDVNRNMNSNSPKEFALDAVAAGLPAARLIPALLDDQQPTETPLRAVVVAPPGTGKTTVVPPTLANRLHHRGREGKVVVTQPRRMAARAAARRLAHLTGTKVGEQVGYTVRGDRKTSDATKVEFVTTGILLRRLISNPDATGIATIVLDEVHERQLDTDLTFAMVQQLGELRGTADPLDIVVMSATLDAEFWVGLLTTDGAEPAQTLSVEAVTYPLREHWAPLPGTQRALDARGVTNQFLQHIVQTVIKTVDDEPDGDVLVFLPGAREIDRVAQQLTGATPCEVLPLLGSTPAAEQDRILSPPTSRRTRRIVLATNVAESALTVSGVRIVVDAGLDRQPRLDTGRGVAGLVTVGAAKSAMVQRAGRAAREAPGLVVRCLSDAEFAARPAHRPAEVRTADLTQAVLDLASWGAADGSGLKLPEPLPARAFNAAVDGLTQLGAVERTGLSEKFQVTDLGRKLSVLPVDPRLGRALYDGTEFVGARLAADVVAALSSDERAEGADLGKLLGRLRSTRPKRWIDDAARLLRAASRGNAAPHTGYDSAGPYDPGLVTALAYPQQIARRRPTGGAHGDNAEYLLASGTAASLPRGSSLQGAPWLAIADVTLHGERAIIRTAAELDQDYAELAAGTLLTEQTQARFVDGKVSARAIVQLGAIQLSSTPIKPTPEHTRDAVAADIRSAGVLEFFGVSAEAKQHASFNSLRARLGMLRRVYGAPWPDVSDIALTDRLYDWLTPELEQLASGARVGRIDLTSALRRLLPWPQASRMAELAPERIGVPSGATVRLDWPAPENHTDDDIASPVLAVKLQECFGWTASPTVAEGQVPVVLHLLSPARRPLAVTVDLASFWQNIYPQVRAENRGRYVKHPWPEDPLTAVATAKTNRALRGGQPPKR